jgi:putative oxidoreductase
VFKPVQNKEGLMQQLFATASNRQINIALILLRVVLGAIFIAHGAQKLFVFGLDGVAGGFASMGVPMAGILGPFVALVEFLGGIALAVGLLTRLASLGIASTMIVAILLVHLKQGFFNPGGVEFPLSLLASTIVLTLTGAGNWSLDALIGQKASPQGPEAERIPALRAA